MFITKPTLIGLLATIGPANAIRTCGTLDPPAELLQKSRELKAHSDALKEAGVMVSKAPITVNTWFHVVAASEALEDGNITDEMLNGQIDVLNSNFAPHSIQFNLTGITRTINSTWSDNGDISAMKTSLRKGDYATLNLYFARAGHWFGLYHTFTGGCNPLSGGDYVDDTPYQASQSEGCPIGRDSCPDQPGLDPIHNYMDYSDDACYEEFTPDQGAKMQDNWAYWRAAS
ncbi:Peptidase M43 pregnancy-associated plasma-A [Macrophomina phaseolina MS6]|uniref:Peptidase M43 pregnancy-associated plasma-A n=1 Tax=Macrophomina phaseolina (strain MS6) TaxID=1126212 RepID=K2RTT7_MACPH|nr:Peptidase M43 pregnancy-associated plasma-A [Macrophomina phaseolina MS6]